MRERFGVDSFVPDLKPQRIQSLIINRVSSKKYLLFDPATPSWAVTNRVGVQILRQCDGTKNTGRIIESLTKSGIKLTHSSLINFLNNELTRQFLLTNEPKQPIQRVPSDSKPRDAWVHLTNECNLRCTHCHLDAGLKLEQELSTLEICQLLTNLVKTGISTIILSGGEPLYRNDLFDILIYFRKLHARYPIKLITNGTLINDEVAAKLKNLNIDVQVSLDGANSYSNDIIRGEGSFEKTINGVKLLIANGISPSIKVTITKYNVKDIEGFFDLCKNLGIRRIGFSPVQLKGRAKIHAKRLKPSFNELLWCFLSILKLKTKLKESIQVYVTLDMYRGMHKENCGAGYYQISISADGKIYPCPALHVDKLCIGNVRSEDISKICENSNTLGIYRALTVDDFPRCKNCDVRYICGGSCRADAYYAYGRLDREPPYCSVLHRLYWLWLKSNAALETEENLEGSFNVC